MTVARHEYPIHSQYFDIGRTRVTFVFVIIIFLIHFLHYLA